MKRTLETYRLQTKHMCGCMV